MTFTTTVNWKGTAVAAQARKAAMDGLEETMQAVIMPDADEHCPVDRGTMRGSHDTQRSDSEGCVVGGYGGAAAPYALRQHEDTGLSHTVGEAKWLEKAFQRGSGQANSIVSARVGAVLR